MPTKRYSDDFETVITIDEKGNEKKSAIYHGSYYEVLLDENGFRRFKRNSLLLLALISILHISAGFLGNTGMYQFYVSLPYVFAFFPLLFMAVSAFRLPNEKRKFRRDEIGLSFNRLKTTNKILMVFLAIGVIGEIIFLIFVYAGNQSVLEFLYLSFQVPAVAAAYYFIRLQRQIRVNLLV